MDPMQPDEEDEGASAAAGVQAALDSLVSFLGHEDPAVVARAGSAVADLGPVCAPALARALSGASTAAYAAALVGALMTYGLAATATVTDALARAAQQAPDRRVRHLAQTCLAQLRQAVFFRQANAAGRNTTK